jgi:hypothetical protein
LIEDAPPTRRRNASSAPRKVGACSSLLTSILGSVVRQNAQKAQGQDDTSASSSSASSRVFCLTWMQTRHSQQLIALANGSLSASGMFATRRRIAESESGMP